MCPAKKKVPTKPPPKTKELKDTKMREPPHKEVPKLRVNPGAGWSAENFNFLKSIPPAEVPDSIYKMFGIPLLYKTDDQHSAVHIFVEFHARAFGLAAQFAEIYKSMKMIAMLSDYLASVPAFASPRDSFNDWVTRVRVELDNGDFTKADVQLVEAFIESHLRANAHVLHFVLTDDIVKRYDKEGLKLFRTVVPPRPEKDAANKPEEKVEVVESFAVVDERLNDAKMQRERELQEQLREFVAQKFEEISEVVERRQDQLIAQIVGLQDAIDGTGRTKRG
jgi:hypothetical protein